MNAPHVLFVCVKNGGKSQMAAGLMRHAMAADPGAPVDVSSAGTRAGSGLNAQSVQSLSELGVDISDQHPTQLTDGMVAAADLVVVLGDEAHVEPADGTPVEVWHTDEPSHRGVEGLERMGLIRDDIAFRVEDLHRRVTAPDAPREEMRRPS